MRANKLLRFSTASNILIDNKQNDLTQPRYGDSDFQPADPKARGKWSDGDSNEGDSGYDKNGERIAAAENYG